MEIRSFRYSARPSRRKKSFIKRLLPAIIILLLLVSSSSYTYAAISKPLSPLTVSLSTRTPVVAESVTLPWPSTGQAAIGNMEDGILAQSSIVQTARPIASTAKIVTALAVMKQKPFQVGSSGAYITFDAVDVGYYDSYVAKGGSVAAVAAGEHISQYQALQAMLIPSANNVADSLARWAFGSIDTYKTYAAAMLKDMGLTSTTITDASGFIPATTSTPSDLIILSQQALANPVIKQIVGQKEAVIPVAGIIINTNQLLPDKALGIKTGHTNEAGWCLLFAHEFTSPSGQKTILIGVILGVSSSGALYIAAENLLTAAASSFSERELVKKDEVVGSYSSSWGTSGNIIADETLSIYGWKGKELSPVASSTLTGTTVKAGQDVGTIGIGTKQVHLRAQKEITPPSVWWKLSHYF